MPHEHSILVVDDDASTRAATTALLEEHGFRSWTARDGREALRRLNQPRKPCLILLDLMMPGMTGWEFLERHRESGSLRAVPLVLVTGWLSTEKAQAKAMVSKPIDPVHLLSALQRVLSDGQCGSAARGRKKSAARKAGKTTRARRRARPA
jgi:CheY-like chemotaxis protein